MGFRHLTANQPLRDYARPLHSVNSQVLKHVLLTLLIALLPSVAKAETEQLAGDPDDPDFITATLLIASPGDAIYQFTGHSMLLMECPDAGLSYVFSFESQNSEAGLLTNLTSLSNGRFVAVAPDDYLAEFRHAGRTISGLRLNLLPREKQELWRNLDALLLRPEQPFNIRWQNCSSQLIDAIAASIRPSRIVALNSPILGQQNGTAFSEMAHLSSPWFSTFIKLTVGNQCNDTDRLAGQSLPTVVLNQWDKYAIVTADGQSRPLFEAPQIIYAPPHSNDGSPWFTPLLASLILLMLSIISIALRLLQKGHLAVRAITAIFLALTTSVGLLLILAVCTPAAIGGLANAYMIIFSPMPIIVWLAARHRPRMFHRLRIAYSAILLIFAILGPMLLAGFDAPLIITTLSLALAFFPVRYSLQSVL